MNGSPGPREPGPREPILNAPASVLFLVVGLIAAHGLRIFLGIDADRFALVSSHLARGELSGLITYQLVHGGWPHVLVNSAFILAFGAPVARFLGEGSSPAGPRGGLGTVVFFAFFLVCGALAALGFAGLSAILSLWDRSQSEWILVGASGSASGLMGAAARLIEGRGRLGAMFGRTAGGMTMGWILINVVLGVSGLTPGAGDLPVAWQAHILGYFAGLFLIGPFSRVAGVRDDHEIAL